MCRGGGILTEWLLPTPEVSVSNLQISKIFKFYQSMAIYRKDENKVESPGIGRLKILCNLKG